MSQKVRYLLGALLVPFGVSPLLAESSDWPQFHGPNRNLKTTYVDLNIQWPNGQPAKLWQKQVGNGWSGPVVADGKLILHHRVEDEEIVACFDALTGDPKWEYLYPTRYRDQFGFDDGPRATPCINDGRVYAYGAEGRLSCIDFETGTLIWSVDAKKEYKADLGFFGLNCSPLIWADRVLMQIGGPGGHGIMAFDKKTGEVKWSFTNHEAGYSSPVATEFNGRPYAIFFTRDGVTGMDPKSGFVEFEIPWRAKLQASVNAASPVVTDQGIFISASYGVGATLLKLSDTGAKPFWKGDGILSNHYATSIYHKHMLFGFHGRVDTGGPVELRCINAMNGSRLWGNELIDPGTLMLVDDTLLILTQSGELHAGKASARGFKSTENAQILGKDTRAYPALANGVYYARDKNKLIALDLRKESKQP